MNNTVINVRILNLLVVFNDDYMSKLFIMRSIAVCGN
jgi:hypothetical protein